MRKAKIEKLLCLMFLFFGFIAFCPQQVSADFYVIPVRPRAITVKTIQVNCDSGQTINQALQKANPGDTIQVQGTCNEAVTLISPNHDRLKIDGLGTAIINGGGQDVITIDGVHKVVITGLIIQNGNRGMIGKVRSSFEVSETEVQNCTDDGIQVIDNSTALIKNCTVSESGRYGVGIFNTSNATITGTLTCALNNIDGLIISESSSAYIDEANVTTNNNSKRGVSVAGSSGLFCYNSTIFSHHNTLDGILAMEVSSLNLFNSTVTASDNGRFGIAIHLNSSGKFTGGVVSQSNTSGGLSIRDNSTLLSVSITVNGNSGNGISVDNGSSLNCCNSSITGNSVNDLVLTFRSQATLFGNTIVNISNDSNSLIRYIDLCYP